MQGQLAEEQVIISLTQELLPVFQLCGHIDIRLKQMKKRSIFEVGLSRSCKSTLFNIINNITHIGVPSMGT